MPSAVPGQVFSAFDALPFWSFAGIKFPVRNASIKGNLRKHVHEYSHQNGGDPEKLGRKLYSINVTALFQNRFALYGPDLWPNNLAKLRNLFEQGATETLIIPTIGSIQAYCVNWTQSMDAKIRSGETVTLDFEEDSGNEGLVIVLTSAQTQSVQNLGDTLNAAIASLKLPQADQDLFTTIHNLVGSITAIQDTAALYGTMWASQIENLINLCAQADALQSMQSASCLEAGSELSAMLAGIPTLPVFGSTLNSALLLQYGLNVPIETIVESQTSTVAAVQALHDLWAAALTLQNDLQSKGLDLQTWRTPVTMTIQGVSVYLYGDTSRVTELLANNANALGDPAAILPGTIIFYYPVV